MKKSYIQHWSNYLIELLIVIIGISCAFWLNNLSEDSNNKKQKLIYLTDIRNDLKIDSLLLSSNIAHNNRKSKMLNTSLVQIGRNTPIDSLLPNVLEIGNYYFFNPDNFTLTSLIQSGDLKLIDSEKTKRELLRLLKIYESLDKMQNNFLDALDNNYFPMLISKVDMVSIKAIDESFFYDTEIKNYCAYALNETNQHIRNYEIARDQVSRVMMLINEDLKE